MSSAFPSSLIRNANPENGVFTTRFKDYGAMMGRDRVTSWPPSNLSASGTGDFSDLDTAFVENKKTKKKRQFPSKAAIFSQMALHGLDITLLSIFTTLFIKEGNIRRGLSFPDTVLKLSEENFLGPIPLPAVFMTVAAFTWVNVILRGLQFGCTDAKHHGMISKSVLLAGVTQAVVTVAVLISFLKGVIGHFDADSTHDFKIANAGFAISMLPNVGVFSYLTYKALSKSLPLLENMWRAKDITLTIGMLSSFVEALCFGAEAPWAYTAAACCAGLIASNADAFYQLVKLNVARRQAEKDKPSLFSRHGDDEAPEEGGRSLGSWHGSWGSTGRRTPESRSPHGSFDAADFASKDRLFSGDVVFDFPANLVSAGKKKGPTGYVFVKADPAFSKFTQKANGNGAGAGGSNGHRAEPETLYTAPPYISQPQPPRILAAYPPQLAGGKGVPPQAHVPDSRRIPGEMVGHINETKAAGPSKPMRTFAELRAQSIARAASAAPVPPAPPAPTPSGVVIVTNPFHDQAVNREASCLSDGSTDLNRGLEAYALMHQAPSKPYRFGEESDREA